MNAFPPQPDPFHPDTSAQRFEELLQQLMDETLQAHDIEELNTLLRQSETARSHYQQSMKLHAALMRQAPNLDLHAATPLSQSRIVKRWHVAVAACVLFGLGFSVFILRRPTATLAGCSAALWEETSAAFLDSKKPLLHRELNLRNGYAQINYANGVQVIVEGPCQFQVTSDNSMLVSRGRATVKVPHQVNHFHLDTPSGRITDLGTEFGVAIGSSEEGPVILTEVFDGEIEIPASNSDRQRLQSGNSLAILGRDNTRRLLVSLDNYPIDLSDSARCLPLRVSRASNAGNLALGKPVYSPAHYIMPHGSVFPPHALTDGRLNDSGTPGDWSFWLAPNGENGEFVVDLQRVEEIGRVALQNTRNRIHGDRGMQTFLLQASVDGVIYHDVLQGQLDPIRETPRAGVDFPFANFTFPPLHARFVKLIGLSHYRDPARDTNEPNHSGGLNEIQIFAR